MSVVEAIEELRAIAQQNDAERKAVDAAKQLRDVEEVERKLKKIGVTLKPKFDISLRARIG